MRSNGVVTRSFRADPAEFEVWCPSERMRDAIEQVFSDLPPARGSSPVTTIELREDDEDSFTVWVDGQRRFRPKSANAALAAIVTTVTRISLDADPHRLHLHSAAVHLEGAGLLISARSGAGKTTVTAALLSHGWTYGSDESVAFDESEPTVHTFPKPLLIRAGGAELVPAISQKAIALDPADESVAAVPVGPLGIPVDQVFRPSCIVILSEREDANAAPSVQAIHPADAVVAMMAQTMDASRYGSDAVTTLSRIAAGSRCVRMTVGHLDAAVAELTELVTTSPSTIPYRPLPPPGDRVSEWEVPLSIRSTILGDRCVVHDTQAGVIVALDEAATLAWRALHADAPTMWQDEVFHSAPTQAFFRELAGVGLLAAADA